MNRPDQKPLPPRPIDATMHGVTDYTVGTMLMTAFPKIANLEGTRAEGQIRAAGAIHAGYSVFTDYPLGAVKVIPYQAHLAMDAVGAVALAATPFVTGQYKQGPKEWVPHVALALFELASLAMTDPTGRGSYHGDPERMREVNMMDPHPATRDGGPAVVPASA
ncbi:MAG: hypothetical protein ACJ762_16940 [Solirubrobacteraceae bacterium]